MILSITLLSSILFVTSLTVPQSWPCTWYSSLVTTRLYFNQEPYYNYANYIAYDEGNQTLCILDKRNLFNPEEIQILELCDYGSQQYYKLNTSSTPTCNEMHPLFGYMMPISWPSEFVEQAQLIGTNIVAGKSCNHFWLDKVLIRGVEVQLDVWTAIDTGYPCEIVLTDLTARQVTTLAFDAFQDGIPQSALDQCNIAKTKCQPKIKVCQVKQTASVSALIGALNWLCDPDIFDCSPIKAGGAFFLPNTPKDHSNWAFNAYYQANKGNQGACNFGGTAELIDLETGDVEEFDPFEFFFFTSVNQQPGCSLF